MVDFTPGTQMRNFYHIIQFPPVTPHVESRGSYADNAFGQEGSTLIPFLNFWDHSIQAQGQKERRLYLNRNFWDQPTYLHKHPASPPHQKENQPYFSNSQAELQKNPTWHEGNNLNYGIQITRLNSPEGKHLAFQDLIPLSYPVGQKEAHLSHLSYRGRCYAGGSTTTPLAQRQSTCFTRPHFIFCSCTRGEPRHQPSVH